MVIPDIGPYGDALDWGGRERWLPGERAWFEYHCYEGHDSSDAQAWYRSHRQVTVVSEDACDGQREFLPTHAERAEAAMPLVYRVRWDDGFEYDAWEDELLVSPTHFCCKEPPPENEWRNR